MRAELTVLHRAAGLILAPFVIALAITGLVYLFKDEIDAAAHAIPASATRDAPFVGPSHAMSAAQTATGGEAVALIWRGEHAPVEIRVEMRGRGHASVYLDPGTGAVLKTLEDRERVSEIAKKLHGTLFAGLTGSLLVEAAAIWAIAMTLSGLAITIPTLARRLRSGAVQMTHALGGVGISALLAVWLGSGLPWTEVGGSNLVRLATYTQSGWWDAPQSQAHHHSSWAMQTLDAPASDPRPNQGHNLGPDQRRSIEDVFVDAREMGFHAPFEVRPPRGPDDAFLAIARPEAPSAYRNTYFDQYDGTVLRDVRWDDFGPIAKAVEVGVAFHEGRLFGWINKALGVIVCIGAAGLAATGLAMWMKSPRRWPGRWPDRSPEHGSIRRYVPLAGAAILLTLLTPLFAATLVIGVLVTWTITRTRAFCKRTST